MVRDHTIQVVQVLRTTAGIPRQQKTAIFPPSGITHSVLWLLSDWVDDGKFPFYHGVAGRLCQPQDQLHLHLFNPVHWHHTQFL